MLRRVKLAASAAGRDPDEPPGCFGVFSTSLALKTSLNSL